MSRLLIEGGRILSFDPDVGDIERGALLIEDGRIVERGRHDELLDRGGLYTELYRRQFAAQEDDPMAAADR